MPECAVADFIGTGGVLAAGLVFALATVKDPDQTMDEVLRGLLRFNAEG